MHAAYIYIFNLNKVICMQHIYYICCMHITLLRLNIYIYICWMHITLLWLNIYMLHAYNFEVKNIYILHPYNFLEVKYIYAACI